MRAPVAIFLASFLVVTFGSVLVLTNNVSSSSSNHSRHDGRKHVRRSTRRYLYNYSSNKSGSSSSGSSSSSSSSSGSGSSSSNTDDRYMNPNYNYDSSNPYGTSSSSSSSGYSDSSATYNNENKQNQNYDNANYVWQRDDDDDVYANNENWSSNHNYKAYSSSGYYNGRGSSYGGQSVQQTPDQSEAEVYIVGNEDAEQLRFFHWFKQLSGKETASLVILMTVSGIFFTLLLLGHSSIVDICSATCCGVCCGHKKTVDDTTTLADTIEDGFVKIGDF